MGAVGLVVWSLLLVVGWFGVGGPVLAWFNQLSTSVFGYTMYVLPVLLVYLAVEIFRAEANRLPLAMKCAAVLEIVWLSGLFGLLKSPSRPQAGGLVGDTANSAMLSLVDPGIAALLYVVLFLFDGVVYHTNVTFCGDCQIRSVGSA